jgi:hypothetical protein
MTNPMLAAVIEARRGLNALYLEAPELVVKDVTARVEAAFEAIAATAAQPETRVAAAEWMVREQLSRRLDGMADFCTNVIESKVCYEHTPTLARDWCRACVCQRAANLLAETK